MGYTGSAKYEWWVTYLVYYWIWIIGEFKLWVNMVNVCVKIMGSYDLFMNMNYKWIWFISEYDLCVNMNYEWKWIIGGVLLGFESHILPKRPFLTTFSKNNGPKKIEKLGTWQNSIWFINLRPFLYRDTLGLLPMSLKWHQSWLRHIYQAISMNEPALSLQLLNHFQ